MITRVRRNPVFPRQILYRLTALILAACGLAPAVQAQEAYTLRPGDVLEFWVAQDEQLNRSVTVGPDGRLSLPMVGHLNVEGRTVDEVEHDVTERLRRYYADSLDIAIMLQPHPSHLPAVFVAGEVAEPGVFPYRPGMTVLHAMTLAGGPFRSPLSVSDVDRSILLRSEIEAAQKEGAELSFAIARIEAELAGSNEILPPADLPFDLSEAQLVDILAREQRLLDMRLAALGTAAGVAGQLREANTQSVESIRQQRQTIDRRRQLLEERMAATATLVERGHMQRSLLLEHQGELAALDGLAGELEAQIAAAQALAIQDASSEDARANERQIELVTELNDARRRLEALNARLADNRRALAVYERDDSGSRPANAALAYRIMRTTDGTSIEMDASPMTMLMPGDLVEVMKVSGVGQANATVDQNASSSRATEHH
jgi:protein involved in polysaccharide export with SLBB domain